MAHCPQGLTRLHPPKVLQTCGWYMAPGHAARLCGKDPGIEQIAREDSRCGYREQHDSLGRMSPQELKRAADRAGKVAVATEVTRLITASSTATQPQAAAVLRARLGAGSPADAADLTPGLARAGLPPARDGRGSTLSPGPTRAPHHASAGARSAGGPRGPRCGAGSAECRGSRPGNPGAGRAKRRGPTTFVPCPPRARRDDIAGLTA